MRRFMSSVSNLSKTFSEALKLGSVQTKESNPALGFEYPAQLGSLNDQLRSETYLSGKNSPSEADAVVLAKVLPLVAKFSKEDSVANRHIVRWADQLQHELDVENKVTIDADLEAEREIKKKEKKEAKSQEQQPKKEKKPKAQKNDKGGAAGGSKEAPKEAPKEASSTKETTEASDAPKAAKEKKPKAPKAPKAAPVAAPVTPGRIDLRVGFIRKAIPHPDADSLYVSTIDVGEEEPRTICSGLRGFVSLEDMQERYIVVVANLKPVKMRGIVSAGMVLCASTRDHTQVEFINPPSGSKPGDKLFFEGFDDEPDAQLNPKKKVWEQIQPGFTTTDELEVTYTKDDKVHKLVNKAGAVLKAGSIKQAFVS